MNIVFRDTNLYFKLTILDLIYQEGVGELMHEISGGFCNSYNCKY